MILPPFLHICADTQLADDPVGDAVIPAASVLSLLTTTGLGQVNQRNVHALVAQSPRGSRRQAGLACLPWCQHVAVFAIVQARI